MSSTPVFAPLWRRLAACLYDLFPVLGLLMVTGAAALLVTHGTMDARHPPLGYQLALIGVLAGYFGLSWAFGGQTLGARAWRVRVARPDGGAVPLPRALLRFVVAWISLLALGLGFLWPLIDKQQRSWHDLAAGTVLVRTGQA